MNKKREDMKTFVKFNLCIYYAFIRPKIENITSRVWKVCMCVRGVYTCTNCIKENRHNTMTEKNNSFNK